MRTLILRIPDDLALELEAEAKRTHCTKSEIVRQRLIAAGGESPGGATGFGTIADLVGSVAGGQVDMSSRKKHYLATKNYGKSRHR